MTSAAPPLTTLPALPAQQARAFLAFAGQLADAAAAITLPFFLQPPPVEAKADASPVTQADRAAEMAMRELISARFPDHAVAGEEFGGTLDDAAAAHEFAWALDPIDGTRGFISGSPLFATLIALLHRGVPVLGVLDFPALGERITGVATQTYRAARLRRVGGAAQAAAVADAPPPLAQAVAVCTTPGLSDGKTNARWRGFYASCGHVRLGGDAHAYRCVAAGAAHIALDCDMQPHDYLPLLPVLTAAGGIMSDWDGRPLAPYSRGKKTVLACATPALWQEALTALREQN